MPSAEKDRGKWWIGNADADPLLSADYDAGRITPEGRARLDKYGSTLDAGNVRLLCERIADYPEVLTAAAEVLAADERVIEAATRAVWDHFYGGGQARRYGTKGWPPPEQHMPWWRGIAEAALNATRDLPPEQKPPPPGPGATSRMATEVVITEATPHSLTDCWCGKHHAREDFL